MTVDGTLDKIRKKARRLTGRFSDNQLSDDELDDYINSYYQYDLPESLRLLNLRVDYSFILEPNVGEYAFPGNDYVSIQQPAYIAGYEIQYYQDKQTFYEFYPQIQQPQTLTSGDGTAGPFTGNITAVPIIHGTVLISTIDSIGDPLSCEDDGSGNLSGDATGTIDYTTGLVSALTWTSTIDAGESIYSQVSNYQAARPNGVLFDQNKLTFRPIPDKAYKFTITSFVKPTALLVANDVPELIEWWELLAMGAGLKIFADNLDMESYAKLSGLYDKHLCLVERRTLKLLANQRASTIYGSYDYWPNSGGYPYI